jgi:hypothetical protein
MTHMTHMTHGFQDCRSFDTNGHHSSKDFKPMGKRPPDVSYGSHVSRGLGATTLSTRAEVSIKAEQATMYSVFCRGLRQTLKPMDFCYLRGALVCPTVHVPRGSVERSGQLGQAPILNFFVNVKSRCPL